MGKISVVYSTRTGNSQKLAKAIGEKLKVNIEDAGATPSLGPADLIFIVGGIYAAKCSPELISFAQKLDSGLVKKAVLVTSSASKSNRKQSDIRRILGEKGIAVLDEITCPGNFLIINRKRPNNTDLAAVSERAKQIARAAKRGSE